MVRAKLQSGLRRNPIVLSLKLPQVRIPAKEYNFPFKGEVEQNKRTKLIREQFRSHLRTHQMNSGPEVIYSTAKKISYVHKYPVGLECFFGQTIARYHSSTPNQCDQIWRNFANLDFFRNLWQHLKGLFDIRQSCEPTLGLFVKSFWQNFIVVNGQMLKTILPSGHTAPNPLNRAGRQYISCYVSLWSSLWTRNFSLYGKTTDHNKLLASEVQVQISQRAYIYYVALKQLRSFNTVTVAVNIR